MKDIFGRTLVIGPGDDYYRDYEDAEEAYVWKIGDEWLVTEDTPRVTQPARFRLPLYEYQLASIYTMHQMETYKCFTGATRDYYSQAMVLSNDMGSGKTPTLLGLIASAPVPNNGPVYPITIDHYSRHDTYRIASGKPCGVITREFRTVLRPAIIFVGYGVLDQWESEITKFTGYTEERASAMNASRGKGPRVTHTKGAFNTFLIDGIAALKQFYAIVHTKQINRYDIVLVKNKDITGNWEWTHGEIEEDIVNKGTRKIYNMIAVICRNMCFTRVVIDDFDTIGVPPIAGNINALSTWLISSTQKEISGRNWNNHEHTTIERMIHHNNVVFSNILKNRVLYSLFNVRVSGDFIRARMTVGRPRYFYYKFDNTAGRVLDLINCMAGDRVSAIMEALNGDAVGEAARIAGIEATDPNQIFKALLQQNYTRLAEAVEVLKHFSEYFDTLDIDRLPPYSDNPNCDGDDRDTYTRKDVRRRRPLEWRYPGIRQLLDEERDKWTKQRDECSACMQKFKDSVNANECAVCNLELDDPDENYAIMPCCNEVLHADCAVRGCNFRKEHVGNEIVISGRCPFDKSHRVLWDKMTYIRGGVDLSGIDENKILDQPVEPAETRDTPKVRPRTKYTAIMDIVNGVVPEGQTAISLRVPSVMSGKCHLPDPAYIDIVPRVRADMARAGISPRVADELMSRLFPELRPRVLIFANFDESLTRVEEHLSEDGVAYERLGGTMHQIAQQIGAFNSRRVDVLLIKSATHCSSLNLQAATDLVFAHQIKDGHVMRQVIGRIQRAGRVTNARVHWMLFDNEIGSLDAYKCEAE